MKIGEIKGMLIPGKFESRVPNWIYRDPQGWVTTKFLTATVSDLLHGWQIYKTGQAGRLQSTFPVPDVTLFISVNAICSHSTTIVLLLCLGVTRAAATCCKCLDTSPCLATVHMTTWGTAGKILLHLLTGRLSASATGTT